MNDILMTNIFFLITAVSSVIITFVLVTALVYFIKLLKRLDKISQSVQDEALNVISDVEGVRLAVRQHISVVRNVMSAAFVKGLVEKLFTSHNGDTYEKRNTKNNKKSSK